MRSVITCVTAVALVLLGSTLRTAPVFQAIDLGALPSSFERSEAYAINNRGQVVGDSSATNSYRAVMWSAQSAGSPITDLGVLPDMRSAQAFSINERGQVVGISVNGDRQRAFIWNPTTPNLTTGAIVELNNLHGERNRSRASGINASGQVVGSTGVDAFLWTPHIPNGSSGESVDLGDLPGGANVSFAMAINTSGQVVGASDTDVGDRAFLWTPTAPNRTAGTMIDLGSLVEDGSSFAAAINDTGAVAGSSATASGAEHAVVWSSGTHSITDLGDLPGGLDLSAATDINADGHVVGHSNSSESEHAFLWTPSDGMRDLNNLLDQTSDPAWTLYYAQSINDAGQIVGWGDYDPDGAAGEQFSPVIHAYLLVPVAAIEGDFNGDGVVDTADYVVWRKGLGTTYTQADFALWRANFGRTSNGVTGSLRPLSNAAVPEPASVLIALSALAALCARHRQGQFALKARGSPARPTSALRMAVYCGNGVDGR